ncbi:MAG: GNAT family N-acetyltransferase [Candidatus Brocadiaceae bacterium]|jgi:beta-glucuronidase
MMRAEMRLNGLWRFQPDVYGEGEDAGYWRAEYDAGRWREVRVPSTFDSCLPGLDFYEGVGWFRRSFSVPAGWEGRRVVLRFGAVNYHARVWVNGALAGEHEDPFLPFAFPVHDLLDYGRSNVVTVEVDNLRRRGEVPGRECGWRTFGGILRSVELVNTEQLFIGNVRLVGDPADCCVSAEVDVGGRLREAGQAAVEGEVVGPDGERCADFPTIAVDIPAEGTARLTLQAGVPGARPWSPGEPALYTASLRLMREGQATDQVETRFGFRKVTVRDGRLLLNGEPVFLTGFNRHEDSFRADQCTDLETARRDFARMKQMGCNFVRLAHYPHDPGELDLCDELGLLAMGEIPLYWWNGLEEGEENCARKLAAAKRQLSAMVRRDINHPSLIFWSVSNETREQRPEVAAGNAELIRLARELDPTRLACHVSDQWYREQGDFREDDVICVNAYPSWSSLWPHTEETEPRDSAEAWRHKLAKLHDRHPQRPILVTEFGHPSIEGAHGGAVGEDTQARVIEAEAAGMEAPYVCGWTVWCYADHAWPPGRDFLAGVTVSPFGVVTRDRRRLEAFDVVRRLFRRKQEPGEEGRESADTVPAEGDPVNMIRPHMRDIPRVAFPPGFSIRTMRRGEAGLWTDVQRDSEPFFPVSDDLFFQEFGDDLPATEWRCFFMIDDRGAAVGTISAWYSRAFRGQDYGRIHWLAVRPAYRRRGLAKAAMSHAMERLAEWHERAWLTTSTRRIGAIKLYLDFGFVPDLEPDGACEAWRSVRSDLDHSTLGELDF